MIVTRPPLQVDVLIVGGGPVGRLLAQRLAGSGLDILLVDAGPGAEDDPRALALSWGSRQLLNEAGLWDTALAPSAISRVEVSQPGTLGRLHLEADELGLPELGCVVGYGALSALLRQRVQAGRVPCLTAEVTALRTLGGYATARLQQQDQEWSITARLAVLADGGRLAASLPRAVPCHKPYRQQALLAMLTPSAAHRQCAWECFTPRGPLALLPYGEQLALVWALADDHADELLAADDDIFLAALHAALGEQGPRFLAAGPRNHYPLALKTLERNCGPRWVAIGNAAQTLHPIAGQGLNLGLRDADTLAQLLLSSPHSDCGSAAQLARYARLRRRDAGAVTAFTDGLVELFRSPGGPLQHARSLGLLALDVCPPARRALARQLVFGWR